MFVLYKIHLLRGTIHVLQQALVVFDEDLIVVVVQLITVIVAMLTGKITKVGIIRCSVMNVIAAVVIGHGLHGDLNFAGKKDELLVVDFQVSKEDIVL
ncbi:hypothetical protein DGG96_14470 [Legionella qingyii]|uniref:Uncharacterized protein n=1 Tax=Legionella qingyii TaxID=2184757 RepID=A0A317TZ12_9GAMM|nr:hypothetical protein [Legionella qingyii]PWY54933.1 hypothetical protein DGG96_14470 [Legionella qingyii]